MNNCCPCVCDKHSRCGKQMHCTVTMQLQACIADHLKVHSAAEVPVRLGVHIAT